MKKVLFIVNPVSGKQAGLKLKEIIISGLCGVLKREDFDIESSVKDTGKQTRYYLADYEIIVIAGGDGTISQVVKEISYLEKRPKLGVIPIGTGNDLANSLGVLHFYESYGLRALLKMILRCKIVNVDIISLNDRLYFTNYFGIGSDAKVSNDFDRLRYKLFFRSICRSSFSKAFYVALGFKNVFYRVPSSVKIRYRKNSSQTETIFNYNGLCQILVTNTNTYACGAILSSKCKMDDGKFEVTIIRSIREWLGILFALLLKKPLDTIYPNLVQFQTDRLELAFSGNTFYQVDGEAYDGFPRVEKKLTFKVASSFEMIVP